jgi:hypothetical protein
MVNICRYSAQNISPSWLYVKSEVTAIFSRRILLYAVTYFMITGCCRSLGQNSSLILSQNFYTLCSGFKMILPLTLQHKL